MCTLSAGIKRTVLEALFFDMFSWLRLYREYMRLHYTLRNDHNIPVRVDMRNIYARHLAFLATTSQVDLLAFKANFRDIDKRRLLIRMAI